MHVNTALVANYMVIKHNVCVLRSAHFIENIMRDESAARSVKLDQGCEVGVHLCVMFVFCNLIRLWRTWMIYWQKLARDAGQPRNYNVYCNFI